MPNKRQTAEIVEQDVQEVIRSMVQDFGAKRVTIFVRPSHYYPFEVYATCLVGPEDKPQQFVSATFYTTVRFPSLTFVMWKAAGNLYDALQRFQDGLTPLL